MRLNFLKLKTLRSGPMNGGGVGREGGGPATQYGGNRPTKGKQQRLIDGGVAHAPMSVPLGVSVPLGEAKRL